MIRILTALRSAALIGWAFATGGLVAVIVGGFAFRDNLHGRERIVIEDYRAQVTTAPDGSSQRTEIRQVRNVEQEPTPPDRFSRATGYSRE